MTVIRFRILHILWLQLFVAAFALFVSSIYYFQNGQTAEGEFQYNMSVIVGTAAFWLPRLPRFKRGR
jgi:hypothetical protein